jgi:phytoene dehydrogenase-like protein
MEKAMRKNNYDVIVVGAGMAGLTAAAYLSQSNMRVLLIEKEDTCGGLIGSFTMNGHTVDKGARAIIDSGIFFPMMKQLGLNIEFVKNPIRISVGDETIVLDDPSSLDDYGNMLKKLYPQNSNDINAIMIQIKKVMKYMDVLYGIENPLFLPKPYDMKYLGKTMLPWMGKFLINMNKAMKLFEPINDFLRKYTSNEQLINIISQHFFEATPTFFALSYFSLYMDYQYPIGSTQVVVDELKNYILEHGGEIQTSTEVVSIDVDHKTLTSKNQKQFSFDQLLWTGDLNQLYQTIDLQSMISTSLQQTIQEKRKFLADKKGADSIMSVYLIVDIAPLSFKDIIGPHEFYTPNKEGLSSVSLNEVKDGKGAFINDAPAILSWIKKFIKNNTLEISIPSLRDASLSPKNETALIVSTLFDYEFIKHIQSISLYEEVKELVTSMMIEMIGYRFPGFESHVLHTGVSTPLTIASRTFATQGSVTGWSFVNEPFPVETKFLKVSSSVLTPISHIKVAGQFTFNPSGIPVAILTGKLAADAVLKQYKKK